MRYIYFRLLLCLLLCLVGNLATVAQVNDNEITSSLNHTWTTVRSTQGRDFFVTFMPNAATAIDNASLALQLRVATMAEEANVTIEYRGSSSVYKETFKVQKDSVYTYTVPEVRREYAYFTETETGKAVYKSVRVLSDKDISVYACNYANYSYDATMILPIGTLDKEYVLQTFSKDLSATEFTIVATDPTGTTKVYINPSVSTTNGNLANEEFSVSLKCGQAYLVRSFESSGDFSGTKIYANKPVAVFSGNQMASIPNDGALSYDHIYEQVIPLRYWGQKFAVTAAEYSDYNFVRVTAVYDDTKVVIDGEEKVILRKDETYEGEFTGSAWVETSRPTICYSYFTSSPLRWKRPLKRRNSCWMW